MSNIDILRQGIEDFGIEASDKMLADFQKYKEILVEWNQKMNLTGIEDEKEVFINNRHIRNLIITPIVDPISNIYDFP